MAIGVGTEAPNLPCFSDVILVRVSQVATTDLEVIPGVNLAIVSIFCKTLGHGDSFDEQPVVLGGGFGQARDGGFLGHCLSAGYHGVRLLEGDLSMVFLEILQADLKVKFSCPSNDVLTRLLNETLNHRVGLRQTFQPFNQLGQVSRVLRLNSHSHHGGHGELHHLHVVSLLEGGDGSGLHQELVNTNQTTNISSRHILNSLNTATHHEDGPLDRLLVQIFLLAGHKVRSHDSGLHTSSNLAREDTAESIESALVRGGDHL